MADKLALLGGPKVATLSPPPYPIIGPDEVSAAARVVMSGEISDCMRGPVVARMEDDYARYFGTKYALSLGSGTAAIHCALFAVGVKPGTEVLTTNNTWASAINAILHAGGTPVFCDIKPGTLHIDPAEIRRKAGPHTKALIATHLWGVPADMDPIMKAADQHGLAVVEDCSHAHGAVYKDKLVGTIGDVGCFSLQGSKPIVAGEGGVLVTNKKLYYQRAMIPGHHDMRLKDELTIPSLKPFAGLGGYWKYRIPPIAAAIATEQLKRLDEFNAARTANFQRLHSRLSKTVPFIEWLKPPPRSKRGWYGAPAYYRYDQKKVSRDLFLTACLAEGATCLGGTGYDNWYQMPLFQNMKLFSQLWPVKHHNGVEFKPLPKNGLPNDEASRRDLVIFWMHVTQSTDLVDQSAAAIEKVAANMAALAKYQKRK